MTMPLDLVLVRHGQSEGNVVIYNYEKNGIPVPLNYYDKHTVHWRLTSLGVKQAQVTGQWLRDNNLTDFNRHYVSDYVRAKETAGHLALPNAEWLVNFYLGERNWGILDRFTAEERDEKFKKDFEARKIHPFYWTPPRGESMVSLCLRLEKVLDTLHRENSDGKVILVCHGEVMWGLRVILERIPIDKYVKMEDSKNSFDKIHNCQVIEYSRVNPDNAEISPKLNWMRSICPTDLSLSSNVWQEINRPRFSNEQLLRHAERFPRVVDNIEKREK